MSTPAPARVRSGRPLPRLHVVTDDEVLRRRGWPDSAGAVLDAGGREVALHLRGRRTEVRPLLALADALRERAHRSGAALFVNDRVDLALVVAAAGAHLGGRSLPVARARAVLGAGPWIGASCHSAEEAAAAAGDGADYLFVGSMYPTASHPGVDGMGAVGLERAVRAASDLPVLAIGGVGPDEVPHVLEAGGYGVATIRGIWNARDPADAVRRYLEVIR